MLRPFYSLPAIYCSKPPVPGQFYSRNLFHFSYFGSSFLRFLVILVFGLSSLSTCLAPFKLPLFEWWHKATRTEYSVILSWISAAFHQVLQCCSLINLSKSGPFVVHWRSWQICYATMSWHICSPLSILYHSITSCRKFSMCC